MTRRIVFSMSNDTTQPTVVLASARDPRPLPPPLPNSNLPCQSSRFRRAHPDQKFIEFLGDPDLKEIMSSQMGIDWFRQYLVVEFAEEGVDLLIATREMLHRSRLKEQQGGESRREGTGDEQDGGGAEGGGGGGQEGESKPDAGEGDDFDIRKAGREIFDTFIKSGCGAQCNLPGTVVKKVRGDMDQGWV